MRRSATCRPPSRGSNKFRKSDSCLSDLGPETPHARSRASIDGNCGNAALGRSLGSGKAMMGPFAMSSSGQLPASALDEMSIKDRRMDVDGASVEVVVRVRPPSSDELSRDEQRVIEVPDNQTCLFIKDHPPPTPFTFDRVFNEQTAQKDIFEVTGIPLVENCLDGYNSTIFAYGQTGAGKTFTMVGVLEEKDGTPSQKRGLAPRVLVYLFDRIAEQEKMGCSFNVQCSFLEIHNESISDLLKASNTNLQVRENFGANKGGQTIYVENLTYRKVISAENALTIMREGNHNRKIAETKANRQSSRSHSVYTVLMEKTENGIKKQSILNLVDLAGSERNSQTGTNSGNMFKEAVNINKSLSMFGRVINELVKAQKTGGGHIPYRDSKLTYLLQESLGKNTKTSIIANISPMSAESQSTLKFVQRAKHIKNKARVNEVSMCVADPMLQKEIKRLGSELELARTANEALRTQLGSRSEQTEELETSLETIEYLRGSVERLETQASALKAEKVSLGKLVKELFEDCDYLREACFRTDEAMDRVYTAERHCLSRDLALEKERALAEAAQKEQDHLKIVEVLKARLKDAEQEMAQLLEKKESMGDELVVSRSATAMQAEKVGEISRELACTKQALLDKEVNLTKKESELSEVASSASQALQNIQKLNQELEKCEGDLKETQQALQDKEAQLAKRESELSEASTTASQAVQNAQHVNVQLEKCEADLKEARQALQNKDDSLTKKQSELSEVASSASQASHNIQHLNQQLEKCEGDLKEARQALTNETAKCARADQEMLHLKQTIKDQQTSVEKANAQTETVKEENAELKKKLQELEEKLRASETSVSRLQSQNEDLETRLEVHALTNAHQEQYKDQLMVELADSRQAHDRIAEDQQREINQLNNNLLDMESHCEAYRAETDMFYDMQVEVGSVMENISNIMAKFEGERPRAVEEKLRGYEESNSLEPENLAPSISSYRKARNLRVMREKAMRDRPWFRASTPPSGYTQLYGSGVTRSRGGSMSAREWSTYY